MELICIQNQCLKYPMCKNKKVIRCELLLKFYNDCASNFNEPPGGMYTAPKTWSLLDKYFPNTEVITSDDDREA